MIFLPIVERELRVASRKRGTFWTRTAAAVVALLIASGFFATTLVGSFPFNSAALGKGLFAVLTWLSLAVALSAGLFFTADCLSEEKRDGTLGFLFLTDLRGYDVVLGKLLATSLRAVFALLAVLPILAVTLLMGGVTGTQFWQASLALANALFVSLAAGLLVSSLSRDSQKAMGGALVLIVLICAVGPALDKGASSARPTTALTSPVFLFVQSSAWGRGSFWPALLVNQIVGWSLLLLSCVLLPKTWQEKARKTALTTAGRRFSRFGIANRSMASRAKLLEADPVLWLASRSTWQPAVLWAVGVAMLGLLVWFLWVDESGLWFTWNYLAGCLTLVLYLAVASQSSRFFVGARRSGLTELLLATPLTAREIVQGHWRALVRLFAVPLLFCVVIQVIGSVWAQKHTLEQLAAALATAAPATAAGPTNSTVVTNRSYSVTVSSGGVTVVGAGTSATRTVPWLGWIMAASALSGLLTIGGNLLAISWLGSWMGMVSKNASLATLKTIAFAQIIPWFVIGFVSAMAVPLLLLPRLMGGGPNPGNFMIWYPLLTSAIATGLYLAKNIALTIWSRRKLQSDFRARAAHTVLLPVLPMAPPIIPTNSSGAAERQPKPGAF